MYNFQSFFRLFKILFFKNFSTCLIFCFLTLNIQAKRERPRIDNSMGFNRLLSDKNSLLRGVSLSWDGGDPYGSQPKNMPSQESLNALSEKYGFNTLHLYLEGDSSGNTAPAGSNAADCDILVERCAKAGLYLIITVGCNGENGAIHSFPFILDFWKFYAPRYKNETHVLFEAKNEPVAHTAGHWKKEDWDKQVKMYKTIRAKAPDTMILLFSYMGFQNEVAAIDAVNYVKKKGVNWKNAAVAWHGYESLKEIEKCLDFFKTSLSYPATICTEFWPGDTVPNPDIENDESFNAVFESQQTGWLQFQWLAGNDTELPGLVHRLETAGVVWTPDAATCSWPAKSSPNLPAHGSAIGIFDRGRGKFVSGKNNLRADKSTYTGKQNDKFIIEHTGPGLVSFKTSNGCYINSSRKKNELMLNSRTVGINEQFQLFELPNGDMVLRACGNGHLVNSKILNGKSMLVSDANNANNPATNYSFVDGISPTNPPPTSLKIVVKKNDPGPFNGKAHAIPGTIEAINFDHGGENIAYHDKESENLGNFYRPKEGVDIQLSSEGGCVVSWIETGEWLEYTVNIAKTGNYKMVTHYAGGNSSFYVELDGKNISGIIKISETGGWQVWADTSAIVTLPAGKHKMRFVFKGGYNLQKFKFTPVASKKK